jgi:arsenite methyltransferase
MAVHPELRQRYGEYGFDAPRQGLIPTGVGGLLLAGLSAMHKRSGHNRVAAAELFGALALLLTFGIYWHTTRRGKFTVWAELLEGLQLRGDERVLDMGCGRGAVLAMVAKLIPRGRAVGLDLWTADQSGNTPEAAQRNLIAEGVSDRCELKTGDMLAMPFPDNTFDLVVSSMAIHNIGEREWRNHRPRLRAVDEAIRVLKPGGRLVITDFFSSVYARHLRDVGMEDVQQRSLGWRFWYGPWLGAGLVTAVKPAAAEIEPAGPQLLTGSRQN